MKLPEIREMGDAALLAEIDKLSSEARELRFQAAVSPLENPLRLNVIRKTIARIKTVLSERKNAPAEAAKS